jgi:hypothetical protein
VHLHRAAVVLFTVSENLSACCFDSIHCSGSNTYKTDRDTLECSWWFYLLFFTQCRELIEGKKLQPILSRMLTGCFALPWKIQRSSVCFTVSTCAVTLFAVCGSSPLRNMRQ